MYYAFIQDNKINGSGECRCLSDGVENIEISQEVYNNISAYVYKDGAIVPDEEHTAEKEQVRAVREQYFIDYVDWYQSKPLLWEEMTEEEKADVEGYRQYLKDYTKDEGWWEQNPMDFETWKAGQSVIEEME